ncbi:hypothetical protein E2542_SST03077 [Spatholobus suberectus]|nr:hypothetical protein E2542_SST03077 [Spatholobus suberectus]
MELASKERIERKKQNKSVARNSNTNSVVITVYTESVTTRSRRLSEDPTKKTKAHPHFKSNGIAGTQGYDRRALLLAHSRELRNAASENVPLPTNQSPPKTKSKGIWLTQLVRIYSCSSSTQMPPSSTPAEERLMTKSTSSFVVVVMGLPQDYSVLDLKSRFEIYSAISCICIDCDVICYISYQSKDSIDTTVVTSLHPSFEIIFNSKKVLPFPFFSPKASKLPF